MGGVIYASSSSVSQHPTLQTFKNYVYAFNAKSGKQNWNYALQGLESLQLATDSGHVYFVADYPAGDNRDSYSTLYSLTLQGKRAWSHDYRNQIVTGLTARNGYVSVSGGSYNQGKAVSTLYVMKADGQNAWQEDVEAGPISIEDGVLYTRSGLKIIAYDLTSQQELWHTQYGEDVVDKEGFHPYLGWVVVVP